MSPILQWLIGLTVVSELVVTWKLAGYMRRVHHDTWRWMGRPTWRKSKRFVFVPVNGFGFFVFSGMYKKLNDRTVRRYIFAIRAMTIFLLAVTVALALFHRPPPHKSASSDKAASEQLARLGL